MTERASWLEARKCKACGKTFAVLYPHLWRYKDDKGKYFCSWRCLRENERKEAEEMEDKRGTFLTTEQKRAACEMALKGENPMQYLKETGVKNVTTAWDTCRRWAERNWAPGAAADLPKRFGQPAKTLEEFTEEMKEDGVELVYDESIAEEYRREQEQKKANERAREEAAQKDIVCKIELDTLPVCGVRSRVHEDLRYQVDDDGRMYTIVPGGGLYMKFSAEDWVRFSGEVLLALEQLGLRKE